MSTARTQPTMEINPERLTSLKMALIRYRNGLTNIPRDYINVHHEAALRDLPRLCSAMGWQVISCSLVNDGWGDGMKVLSVRVSTSMEPATIRWSDSNGGSWFKDTGHGYALLEVPTYRPGFI